MKSRGPADFHANPGTVGGIGCSSGGHTLLLRAMRPHHRSYDSLNLRGSDDDATLKYVLAPWPIVAPYARYRFAQETGQPRLVELSEGYFLTTDAMKEGSPFQILQREEPADLPPMLVIQGSVDENLPVPVTEQFVVAYRQAGGTIELEMFSGMPHAFGYTAGPEVDRAVALMKNFVGRCLSGGI